MDEKLTEPQTPDTSSNPKTSTSTEDIESTTPDTKGGDEGNMSQHMDPESEVRQSVESDVEESNASDQGDDHGDDVEDDGDESVYSDQEDEHPDYSDNHIPHTDDGGDSSSHHEATDEDVFSDKSPRSSMGSYDGNPEPSKKAHRDLDNMSTATRSPRVSGISQYEKDDFIPTTRETPRPPFRTPSDVRAMQMSSPPASVLGSPRSAKRQFPTVSRLGTPNPTTQYSPKRMSTPQRFKGRKEAPLVLLHVTLLPLRWVWSDLLNTVDASEMSDQAKTLRESWRVLQDRIGDTVIERGILLGHPQNDYEVLEERLLEALELPFRRRARILECGHYLGPSNEMGQAEEEESEDEWSSDKLRTTKKHHWCATCKNEIRYDSLGLGKIFRVKVYASNGLMRAGAWAACWKEMERVDVEIEPLVDPTVQEELVRLAAAHQEEVSMAKEAAQKMEEERLKVEDDLHSRVDATSPRPGRESVRSPTSAEERRWRDEERMREIYGHTPPPSSPRPHSRHSQTDAYRPNPSPIPPQSPRSRQNNYGQKEQQPQPAPYQNASLSELMKQSIRVLMQDRRNVVIFTLGMIVLLLAIRNAPASNEMVYEPVIHRMRDSPVLRRAPQPVETTPIQLNNLPIADPFKTAPSSCDGQLLDEKTVSVEEARHRETVDLVNEYTAYVVEPIEDGEAAASSSLPDESETDSATASPETEAAAIPAESEEQDPESSTTTDEASKLDLPASEEPEAPVAEEAEQPEASNTLAGSETVSTVYEPCRMPYDETETEFVTEKKVVRVVHTVTETEVEMATETVKLAAATSAEEPPFFTSVDAVEEEENDDEQENRHEEEGEEEEEGDSEGLEVEGSHLALEKDSAPAILASLDRDTLTEMGLELETGMGLEDLPSVDADAEIAV